MYLQTSRFAHLAELGQMLADVGLALETTFDAWTRLWEIPALRAIAYIDVPGRFNPFPFSDVGIGCDKCPYSLHLAIIEYLSRFDASSLMALPGSSLSTSAVLALGTEEQIDHFFGRFHSSPQWAFFAVTEPSGGSDVAQIRSHISGRGIRRNLNAVKTLIGSVEQSSVGLVFARLEESQLPCLVIIEPSMNQDRVSFERLHTFGLAGAALCSLEIRDLPIVIEQILGAGRGGLRHGIKAIADVFDRHRPMVGAMALGTAFGLIEILEHAGVERGEIVPLRLWHEALLRSMQKVASHYEQSRLRGHEASLFKLQATKFVQHVASAVSKLLTPEIIFSSPLLRKKYRDAFAFEYMEGVSNIHTQNAYRSYVTSRENHDTSFKTNTHNLG